MNGDNACTSSSSGGAGGDDDDYQNTESSFSEQQQRTTTTMVRGDGEEDDMHRYNTRSKKRPSETSIERGQRGQDSSNHQQQQNLRRSERLLQPFNSDGAAGQVGGGIDDEDKQSSIHRKRQRKMHSSGGDQRSQQQQQRGEMKYCEYCRMQIAADATRCRYCQATLEIVEQMDGEGFIVMKRRRADVDNGGVASESVSVRIVDEGLRRRLQRVLRNESALMHSNAELSLAQLFAARNELRADPQARERTFLAELVQFLDVETRHLADAFEEMRRHGLVSFTMLPHAFPVDTLVYGWHQGRLIGMRVNSVETVSNVLSASVVIKGDAVYSDGSRFLTLTHRIAVQQFDGLARLDALPVRHMTDDVMRRLEERGALFRRYALGHHFVEYGGMMLRRGASRAQSAGDNGSEPASRHEASGRVMIDGAAMRRIQPNYPFIEAGFYREDEADLEETLFEDAPPADGAVSSTAFPSQQHMQQQQKELLADDRLFCTWPIVCGFSFRLKKWGEFFIDSVDQVQWDKDSFNKLVLPDDHRRLVSALVTQVADENDSIAASKKRAQKQQSRRLQQITEQQQQHQHQQQQQLPCSDIVANKGRGCVVLLHGPPGTGKTTTAETVAEHLRLPLYIVSAGELGVTADQLQKRLRSILDLCAVWRSIVLVDEADAFLARRSSNDVSRNALVCVFLRMLEYHSGILFLTTNRIRDFDEAFFSRVHLALPYAPLDRDARLRVWRTMLAMTQMKYSERQIDLPHLASLALNGRQIRTVVRLATMLAKHDESPVLLDNHFALPIRHLQQFETDIVSSSVAAATTTTAVENDAADKE